TFFLGLPGGQLLGGWCCWIGFDDAAVTAQNIVAAFGGFLRDGVADHQLSVFVRVTIHASLHAGREKQSQRSKPGDNRRRGQAVLHLSDSVTVPIVGYVLRVAAKLRVGLQVVQYLLKANDAYHGNVELLFDFLDGGKFSVAFFLSVQGNQDAGRLSPGTTDDLYSFPNGGAGCDDIINNQYFTF